jgi:hypothetical protein
MYHRQAQPCTIHALHSAAITRLHPLPISTTACTSSAPGHHWLAYTMAPHQRCTCVANCSTMHRSSRWIIPAELLPSAIGIVNSGKAEDAIGTPRGCDSPTRSHQCITAFLRPSAALWAPPSMARAPQARQAEAQRQLAPPRGRVSPLNALLLRQGSVWHRGHVLPVPTVFHLLFFSALAS